ncbi:hypothetical protein, partial [Nitrosospira sp. Nsp1]|uniref:hypothetical protein n=1 Tax=Nitrosospira sp. Nsp1 TaxID=136547 RepID=UPI000884F0A9
WATSPQPNLQPTINLQPRILLHRVANYWEQVKIDVLRPRIIEEFKEKKRRIKAGINRFASVLGWKKLL